ncbi:membrane dipeptidase [Flammeovirga sp. SubArs3]|uniref:membrane dipeptidase n=1 Tax=Flammeovirga sp. SubArs3 TaxID=2995316 RepID=UPI00248B395D|nr:membrane dipeptidase [Flammeovirga sp. SubArs3]
MEKFADFHLHLSLKHLVNKGQKGRQSIWDTLDYNPTKHSQKRASGDRYDQSSLSLLIDTNVKIAVIALHPVERFASGTFINRLMSKLICGFQMKTLRNWVQEGVYAFSLLNREIETILSLKKGNNYRKEYPTCLVNGSRKALIPVTKEEVEDEQITKLFLSIEGIHALSDLPMGCTEEELAEEVLKNLHHIQFERNLPIFSLTLCHLTNNSFFKQSWALPMPGIFNYIRIPLMDLLEKPSKPISIYGKRIINQCIDHSRHKRILIDVKHLHIEARYEYYKMLKEKGPNPLDHSDTPSTIYAPIIASHVGVSGMENKEHALTVGNAFNEIKKSKYRRFNPWEINLCDEELQIIMESKGMIGISLDQRILGVRNDQYVEEIKAILINNFGYEYWKSLKPIERKEAIHSAIFLDNLLYIIHKMGHENAWKCVCIGSDYDGIIRPIVVCPTVAYFEYFENYLVQHFEQLRIHTDEEIFIPKGETIASLMRGVFYTNVRDFLNINYLN